MMNRGLHDLLFTFILGKHRTRQAIRRYQSRQLRRLVKHSFEKVPYYRRLMQEAGLEPSDIRGLDDLQRFPITTKVQLKAFPEDDQLACNFDSRRLLVYRTSGSTAEPFTVRNSTLEEWIHALFRLRAYRSFGFRLPERMARLRDPGLGCKSLLWRLIQATGIYEIHELPTSPAEELVRHLRRIRPHSIAGYPGGSYYAALQLSDDDRRVIKPRWATVGGADVLPGMKQRIEDGFGTRVFETYACRETALVAWECKDTGRLHVCDDHLILEILEDGKPVSQGESGEVVVTVLHSFAQPFIRYKISDYVVRGEDSCTCGVPFSTLTNVEGRTNDRIMFEDRPSRPPGPIFDFIETRLPWVRQFQLVQHRLDLVELKLVPMPDSEPGPIEELERVSREFLGPHIHFQIRFVDELTTEAGSKFRPSLCKLLKSEADIPPT